MEDSAVDFFNSMARGVKKTPINWISFPFIIFLTFSVVSRGNKMKESIKAQNEKIDKLGEDFRGLNNRFDRLYEILLKKEIEKK